ncbi:MAG TPA: redoxin domain-containing protein, partial [bacterium]|nr:redoxin domain-containing protein [bacterium]
LLGMSEHHDEFKKADCEILGISVDSKFSHFNWLRMPIAEGGLEGLKYPLLEDLGGVIAEKFGVKAGPKALRASFLVNPEGVIVHGTVNDTSFGRSWKEHLRILHAAQYAAKHGEVCPMEWDEGDPTMKGNFESKKDYFTNKRSKRKHA